MELFRVGDLVFNKEDFLDNISEYEDIIPIVQELSDKLSYELIECVGENDCCSKTNKNYIVEIQGFLNSDDEFLTTEEVKNLEKEAMGLDLFVIRIYKCEDCGKWIIDILE